MKRPLNYVIVGGGIAGNAAAEAIREVDNAGSIVILTDELQRPYDRVPLSKTYLTGNLRRAPYLHHAEYYKQRDIEIRTDCGVKSINVDEKVVTDVNGNRIPYDRLLMATGGRPRPLEISGNELEGIFYLRTLDDAAKIRGALKDASCATVVGGGFIGCEVASSLAAVGLEVRLVEVMPYLMYRVLDRGTAEWLTSRLKDAGVHLVVNAEVVGFSGDARVEKVLIKDGRTWSTDLVVVGVGMIPNAEVVERAGFLVDNGVVVDEYLETSVPGVYAAGDVANYYCSVYGRHLRVEHWDSAIAQGRRAGMNMAGQRDRYDGLPYFFSRFSTVNITGVGTITGWERCVELGAVDDPRGFARLFFSKGKLTGVLGIHVDDSLLDVATEAIRGQAMFERPDVLAVKGPLYEAWSHAFAVNKPDPK